MMPNSTYFRPKAKNYLIYGVLILPVLAYFLLAYLTTVNIPLQDEYDAVLGFGNSFFSPGSNKLALLFSQHNEHRLLLYRGLAALVNFVNGSINIKALTIIGNLTLIGFAVFLFVVSTFRGKSLKPLYFIPVAFMLFQPQYYAIILQSGAIADLGILCFSLASLYFLNKPSMKYLFAAIFMAILAVFSKASGFLIFPAGLIIICTNKKYKEGLIWLLTGAILAITYFTGYVKPVDSPPLALFNQPFETAKFILYFFGGSLSDLIPSFIPFGGALIMLSGALILLYFIFIFTRLRTEKANIVILAFLSFLFMTTLMISVGRSLFGAEYALSSRYKIYSDVFLILIYLTLIEFLPQKALKFTFPVLLILAVLFSFISYKKYYPVMFYTKDVLMNGLAEWKVDNSSGLQYPDPVKANAIMREAKQKGIYKPLYN